MALLTRSGPKNVELRIINQNNFSLSFLRAVMSYSSILSNNLLHSIKDSLFANHLAYYLISINFEIPLFSHFPTPPFFKIDFLKYVRGFFSNSGFPQRLQTTRLCISQVTWGWAAPRIVSRQE